MSNKDILEELKSKIGQKIVPTPPPSAPRESSSREKAPKTAGEKRRKAVKSKAAERVPRTGRGFQFYLDDMDRRIINSLAVWFASQDRRVSDSQVIKAAIRLAEAHQGSKLLDLCDQVRLLDRRRQKKTRPERAGK